MEHAASFFDNLIIFEKIYHKKKIPTSLNHVFFPYVCLMICWWFDMHLPILTGITRFRLRRIYSEAYPFHTLPRFPSQTLRWNESIQSSSTKKNNKNSIVKCECIINNELLAIFIQCWSQNPNINSWHILYQNTTQYIV